MSGFAGPQEPIEMSQDAFRIEAGPEAKSTGTKIDISGRLAERIRHSVRPTGGPHLPN